MSYSEIVMPPSARRPYRKQKRAAQEEATRRRITEAVVELHRTVGPARTTVTEVAERAGVSRVTVYHHFPTDGALIEACSTHWAAQNPFPDPADWSALPDPDRRLAAALTDLYAWYRRSEDMMGKVLRDAPLVPALGELMEERWEGYLDAVVAALEEGRQSAGEEAVAVRAALCLAVDFHTWQTLTRGGLPDAAAARLAARLPLGAVAD